MSAFGCWRWCWRAGPQVCLLAALPSSPPPACLPLSPPSSLQLHCHGQPVRLFVFWRAEIHQPALKSLHNEFCRAHATRLSNSDCEGNNPHHPLAPYPQSLYLFIQAACRSLNEWKRSGKEKRDEKINPACAANCFVLHPHSRPASPRVMCC